jgi:DNA-binding FadR family transcriptional regulator
MYAPGDRLPPERELSEHLGVSRATVREAMRVLQAKGCVESRRGTKGGWFVSAPGVSLSRLRRQLRDAAPAMEDILDFRVAVDGAAARLAAARRTTAAIEQMQSAVEEMRHSRDVPGFRRADTAFHLAVAAAARNPMLYEAVVDARSTMFFLVDAIGFDVLLENSLRAHERIHDAIARADACEAERAAIEHVETTRRELHELFGERGSE